MTILEKVNILILPVTIFYIMAHSSLLSKIDEIPTQVAWLITFLMRVGLFRLLIILVYWLPPIGLPGYGQSKPPKGFGRETLDANLPPDKVRPSFLQGSVEVIDEQSRAADPTQIAMK